MWEKDFQPLEPKMYNPTSLEYILSGSLDKR